MEFPIHFGLHFGLQKINLPLILVEFHKVNLCILLDTGANNNYLERRVYKHFKEHIEELEEKNTFFGIDGNKIINDKVKLKFKFEDDEYETIFDVLPEKTGLEQIENEEEIQIHGILGSIFFMEHKWIIDFAELKIYSKN